MAHYAKIDSEGVVVKIDKVDDINEMTLDCEVAEGNAVSYLRSCDAEENADHRWIKTSYNGNIRGRYATLGGTYDAELDMFIDPKPFPSWVLDSNGNWQPPVPRPDTVGGLTWDWNEDTLTWDREEQ